MVIKNKYIKPDIPANEKVKLEKGFTLDCVAVGTLASDNVSFSPKLASGIPPYNSQNDKMLRKYFQKKDIKKTLQRTGQEGGGESMNGRQADRFSKEGTMGKYLERRNKSGAGYSTMEVAGHDVFMSDPKSLVGYNGTAGFRRNTPTLREKPSLFEGRK